ncbi:MAG: zinc ABC transporter substrate-binding protein [Chloroflexi bacterium]|nr:zinc ABC transporter substrate-binding protein [Chloroflexota bacterium]
MTSLRLMAAAALLLISLTAAAQPDPIRVVATTTQASDITRILTDGLDTFDITSLMGAGVDPHLYKPTESDIRAMNAARMVVYSGLHLEGQFDAVFEALSEQGVLIYAMGKPVKDAGYIVGWMDPAQATAGTDDPHFWFDPRNWEITVLDLAEALGELSPESADVISANAEAYVEKLQVLFTWADEAMRTVPKGQRYLVTSHDAFQYFGAAFGWQMMSVQGISTVDEAGVGDIQSTVQFILDNEIPVLFVESSIPPNTVQAVREAVLAGGGSVRIGVRELYSDAMGDPTTFGGTYVGMIASNVLTIVQSYQCAGVDEAAAPEWPESLDLELPEELTDVDCSA